jgi:transposase
VIERVLAGWLTVGHAAQVLGLSERQVKRLKRGVRRHGPTALPHKNRGRKPKHALPETTRRRIVELGGPA